MTNENEISFLESAVVTYRPELQHEMTWTAIHAFAGAFGGWEQATRWLSLHGESIICGRHISIDADEDVMRTWQRKHESKLFHAPVPCDQPWTSAGEVGILAPIADNSILTLCQAQVNSLGTMSPPCQPWSKGGRHQGLSCENGWLFISGLIFAFKLQVNILTAECADDIVQHEHFGLLTHVAKLMGYRLVWSQVAPLNHMSPQMRTRWLATWIRADLDAKHYDARVTPHAIPRHRWSDPDFEFRVPRVWEEQLLLSESERKFYGDVDFLPTAKRVIFGQGTASQTQVLSARIPKESEPLPTLRASYTIQHELDCKHLEAKGVFAFLRTQPAGFAFLDPAKFVSLHGATEDCILSAKISEAFRGLGNAIATPHALLPVLIGLLSILPDQIDVHAMLQACWKDRLTSSNAIVCHVDSWVHIVRIQNIAKLLQERPRQSHDHLHIDEVKICGGALQVRLYGLPTMTIDRLMRDAISGPADVLYAFMLIGDTQTAHLSRTAQEAKTIQVTWTLSIQGVSCGELTFCEAADVPLVSPTLAPPSNSIQVPLCVQASHRLSHKQILRRRFSASGPWNSLTHRPFVTWVDSVPMEFCSLRPGFRGVLCVYS